MKVGFGSFYIRSTVINSKILKIKDSLEIRPNADCIIKETVGLEVGAAGEIFGHL